MIRIARVYETAAARTPGAVRILVDRVWPRGLQRDSLALDAWAREVAPSAPLRKWFGHDSGRWREFRRRYRRELRRSSATWSPLLERARHNDLELLYGARDTEHNNAVVLREFLLEQFDR